MLGTSTSLSGPTASAARARCSAAVHEFRASACSACLYSRKRSSNRATRGPLPIQPERRHATTSAISGSSMRGEPNTRKSSRAIAEYFGQTGDLHNRMHMGEAVSQGVYGCWGEIGGEGAREARQSNGGGGGGASVCDRIPRRARRVGERSLGASSRGFLRSERGPAGLAHRPRRPSCSLSDRGCDRPRQSRDLEKLPPAGGLGGARSFLL